MKRNGAKRNGPKLTAADRLRKLEDQKKKLELRMQIDNLRKQLKAAK